jgi:hypothetical protein
VGERIISTGRENEEEMKRKESASHERSEKPQGRSDVKE